MFGYRVPAPDEAMLISGGRRGLEGAPFRVVTGHGKFVLPVFRKTRFLTLAMCEAEVSETCVTRQAIALTVRAVIAFKVGNDTESIVNAGQRFLSDQDQMSVLTGRIFAGHLRSIIGSMTVEEIITERQKLATAVLETSKTEMAKIGLTVDSLQIQSIDDGNTGYIDAMSAPHKASIQQMAQIAQARATQASVEAEQFAARNQAEYARQTAVVRAEYSAEVERAQAKAAQAGPLAQAHATQEVLIAQTELAERAAELRQQQLRAEIVKPAEAEAERIRVLAVAEAERMKIQAEAAASYDRVALDRMLIDQLPLIVKEAATGLAGANVNVLNGAEGLSEIAAGLVGQGLTILDSVRKNLSGSTEQRPGKDNGLVALQGYLKPSENPSENPSKKDGPDKPADGPIKID
ncbi:SPFH domain-containing protein [Streptomyces sp. H10-C2]|uniref:flotillin family protein n=1 Tax=unclassified Streptomyces TaxID=2593676 RepID=UPI0024B8FE72|nr:MULTISPECIES: flotillin family protein [unclassified Streptomyces]MDJ0344060.1 SPFH domain-containing protein [Streptomyces sp. PH10-H1]MDJ0368599.1 SPFH domain-containing protein [Streptomyces sp. H10-C2]